MISNFEKLLTDHSDMCCEVEPKDYPPYLDYPKSRKPMTNADRIWAFTDEELAEWIANILICHGNLNRHIQKDWYLECNKECPLYKCCNDQATNSIEGWLKSPVEVDNG